LRVQTGRTQPSVAVVSNTPVNKQAASGQFSGEFTSSAAQKGQRQQPVTTETPTTPTTFASSQSPSVPDSFPASTESISSEFINIDQFITDAQGLFENPGSFVNDGGEVDIQNGGRFVSETGEGFTQLGGRTIVNGELVGDEVNIFGGHIQGSGEISGDLVIGLAGALQPGNSPGVITVDGLFSDGLIELEVDTLDSLALDLFDRIIADTFDVAGEVSFLLEIDVDDFLNNFNIDDFFLVKIRADNGDVIGETGVEDLSVFEQAEFSAVDINGAPVLLTLNDDGSFSEVPLPATVALMLLGLFGVRSRSA
jgi:hypothetical protein